MTRISTLSQNQLILRNTQIIQERLQDLRRQISTGAKADQFGDLGSQSLGMTSALTRVAQAEQFLANNIQTKAKLDLREIAVRAIAEISMNLKAEFIQSEGIEDSRQLQQLAQNELERITSILNSRDQNGAYLFGGSRTNIAPVVKTVNGAAPPAFTFAFNNDLIVEQARIDNGVTIDIGILAGRDAVSAWERGGRQLCGERSAGHSRAPQRLRSLGCPRLRRLGVGPRSWRLRARRQVHSCRATSRRRVVDLRSEVGDGLRGARPPALRQL